MRRAVTAALHNCHHLQSAHIIFVGRLHVVMTVRGAWPLKYLFTPLN
jgi:hypothetical protein